jgi:hypothetical protein
MPEVSNSDAYSTIKGFSMQDARYISKLLEDPDRYFTLEGFYQDIEDDTYVTQVKLRESKNFDFKKDIKKLFEDSRNTGLKSKIEVCSPTVGAPESRQYTSEELKSEFSLKGEETDLEVFAQRFYFDLCKGYEETISDNLSKISERFFCSDEESLVTLAIIHFYIRNNVLFPNKVDYENRKTSLNELSKELRLKYRYQVLELLDRAHKGEDITSLDEFLNLPKRAKENIIHKLDLAKANIDSPTKEEFETIQTQIANNLLISGSLQYRYYFPLMSLLDPFYLDSRGETNRKKIRGLLQINEKTEQEFLNKMLKEDKIERVQEIAIVLKQSEAEEFLREMVENGEIDLGILIRLFIE